MAKRPPIPIEIERLILLEAGHRCAIHTCRQHPVEIAHIVPWSQNREHRFENLIALCPTCHTRFDRHEIDRKSMLIYKRNAWMASQIYSDLEKRLIAELGRSQKSEIWIFGQFELLLTELIRQKLLVDTGETRPGDLSETLRQKRYILTDNGKKLSQMLASYET